MRILGLWLPGVAAAATGLALPWLELDGGERVYTNGTPLLVLSSLLAIATLAALLVTRARLYASIGATLVWGLAMYGGLALLRALPTYAGVHFGSEGTAGPGIPITLIGDTVLVVAAWAGLMTGRAQKVRLGAARRPRDGGSGDP